MNACSPNIISADHHLLNYVSATIKDDFFMAAMISVQSSGLLLAQFGISSKHGRCFSLLQHCAVFLSFLNHRNIL